MSEKCKKEIMINYHVHPCSRNAWKDGYCKQHHPDTIKARSELSQKRWQEKEKQSPWYKLQEANKRIKELENKIKELESKISSFYENNESMKIINQFSKK